MTTNRTAQPCKTNAHKFVTTFDNTNKTGTKRERCIECGILRWTKNGVIETWMPGQYAALAPESNTEAAQQHAAELEQAPHPPACICDECLETANSVWELQHPSTGLLHEVRQRNGYYDAPKTSQPERQSHMFAATNADLPLFSGTAPRGQAQTFDPPAADGHRQAKLF